jgi:[CysO sulfur-carrier protein]-S-L-cysteine hydrolase
VRLILPNEHAERLVQALREAGLREIGGVLMAEHIGSNTFRVADLTIQKQGGTFASFVRLVQGVLVPLRAFFITTGKNYTRFNYIGEWHSHHSFQLTPSDKDNATMFDLVRDPSVGARFAVLLIVRLGADLCSLEHCLTVYLPDGRTAAELVIA